MSNQETNSDNTKQTITKQTIEQQLEAAYQAQSQEQTSLELDQSILQMAQDQLAENEQAKGDNKASKGFWANLFSSKKVKYGFSTAAALFMTVGIARFMVYLSQSPQNANSYVAVNDELAAETVSFEMPELAAAEEAVQEMAAVSKAQESFALQKPKQQTQASELMRNQSVTDQELRQVLADRAGKADSVDSVESAQSEGDLALKSAVAKEAELKQQVAKQQQSNELIAAAPSKKEHSALAARKAETETPLVVTGARVKAESEHAYGTLDEAVAGYPLPEVWLEEIEAHLKAGDQLKALEEWQQLKNTYPEFKAPEPIQKQLAAIAKIGQKSNKE